MIVTKHIILFTKTSMSCYVRKEANRETKDISTNLRYKYKHLKTDLCNQAIRQRKTTI